ncbi:diguanylate cyclase (GGDEF) domain-containing protein [Marinobacter segnicrescens]|uniref:diguanylate cyclase n=1 Tax=Marinobacter segnicrescens TaxID=430453 RepID=A0A1H9YAS3_9GAMM|nr:MULTISPECIES: GGDEF domain-containing protein [Marinobacter]UZD64156.1 GGDEF domain-containing protein [Marinobacter sp. AN1]SES65959.1 diguanylate cyclase (GGDEF) domain-containing protein [Marinobacter segnicrescens]
MAGNNRTPLEASSARPARLVALRQAREAWTQADDPVARLYRRVSMTLSLETLLGIFAEELGQVLPFGQLVYRHRLGHQDFVYTSGMGGPHRCDYQLNLEGNHYGALSLTRRTRFTEDELEAIEFLLGILICPLRNACQYALVEQAALTDSLTEIPNKRALDMALARDCSIGDRHGDAFTLILCDLDYFKDVNDTFGHVIGDHILKATAKALREATRDGDSIFRFGGEEFAVLLPHADSTDGEQVADRIRAAIHDIRIPCGDRQARVTASAGVATRRKEETPVQWLARADDALYRAKDAGRNRTHIAHVIA